MLLALPEMFVDPCYFLTSAAYAEINSCASVMFLEMSHLLFHFED